MVAAAGRRVATGYRETVTARMRGREKRASKDNDGEDEGGRIKGRHIGTGIVRPTFWERARYFGMERELAEALDELQQQ